MTPTRKQPNRTSPGQGDPSRLLMRVLGFVLTVWALWLLTRDVVLSGEFALWFVSATGGVGLFAFIASWRRPRSPQRQARQTQQAGASWIRNIS